MRIICLICFLGIGPEVLAQDPYGTTLTSIGVDGADARILADLPIGAGSTLTRQGVRSAIQALYDRGGYSRIEVEAVPDQGGTALVFRVEAPVFFSTVRVEPRGILERPLSGYISLPYGERFSATRLDEIVAEAKARLEAEGYFATNIVPFSFRHEDTRLVEVTLGVEARAPATVGEVRFEGGEQTFEVRELADAFDVPTGSRFLADRVVDGEDRLRALFADLEGRAGFLNTLVEVSPTWNSEPNTVDLLVRIEPGAYAFVDLRGTSLSDDRIRELVPIFEEGSVDADLIEEGRLSIQEHFVRQGYFEVRVTTPPEPIVTPLDPSQPDEVAVQIIYDVDVGVRHSVAAVRITGNTYFSDREIRSELALSSRGVFSRGVFSPELLEQAASTVRAMYRAAGLVGTEVVASRELERNEITATIDIREGPELRVDRIGVEGNMALGGEEIVTLGSVREGDFYRPSILESGRRAIISEYHARGFANVRVRTQVVDGDSDGTVRIAYSIEEGERFDIGEIFVSGNTRTRTTVVRRHAAALSEAGPYDPEAILEAQRNLYTTGLFNRVDIVPLGRQQAGRRDVLIQVEDAGPLLLSYGVGVYGAQGEEASSTDVDVRGTVEIVHNNLWGLDRSLSARVRAGRREQRFQTTYREPQLFNWDLDGFASLFVERAMRPQFDASRIDFSLQTLYQLAARDNLLVSASFQSVNLKDIRDNSRAYITDEEGNIQVATIGASYVRDSRDDRLDPARGNYFSGSLRIGNRSYGSEVDFTSLFTQLSLYRPARSAVIAGSVRFGWNQPYGSTVSLPITERYFAGGSTTLRAFSLDEAGPEGGGNALFLLNAEYRHPIPFLFSGLSGAFFYDTGTVFPRIGDFSVGDFTHTAGIGLRYATPLGPVRVDFGLNLNRQPAPAPGEPGERANKFHFTLGHAF